MLLLGSFTSTDWWTMATASACAVACAVLGCFLVLRRMSMLGDAISHAILPGIAVAFMISGTRDAMPMLLGAAGAGLTTALLSAALHRFAKVPEDAAMGVVFTTLFALGVVLINEAGRKVDLDPGCVLYGLLELVTFDSVNVLGVDMPTAFVRLVVVLALNVTLVAVFYKELKIVSFDAALATTMGISAGLVHYGLMGMVAATTVVSFEAVGSILVVSMLIAPAAAAHMLTDRLARMIVIAGVLAAMSAVFGYLISLRFDTSIAGMMSVVAGAEFALAALFSPAHGVVGKMVSRAALALRIAREDVLAMLYRWHEKRGPGDPALTPREVRQAIGTGWMAPMLNRAAVIDVKRRGLATLEDGRMTLTGSGLERASQLVRSHRLWETFLAERLNLPLDHVHEPSERMEHFISTDLAGKIGREVGTAKDPHGREIPGG